MSIMRYFIFILLGLTWLMVYRTEKYQKLKAEVEKQSKKCKFLLKLLYSRKYITKIWYKIKNNLSIITTIRTEIVYMQNICIY